MKGDDEVISMLNDVLSAELTGINQYFIHAKMAQNWGYYKLAAHSRQESIEEMRHADVVIQRILYLEGAPNMQRYVPDLGDGHFGLGKTQSQKGCDPSLVGNELQELLAADCGAVFQSLEA